MKHTLAPFTYWTICKNEIKLVCPDNTLTLDKTAAPLLTYLSVGWVDGSNDIDVLNQLGVTITLKDGTIKTLFDLQKYFDNNKIKLIVEQKGATVSEAAIQRFGYRVTSPGDQAVGYGQDHYKWLALLKAVVEFYERYSCNIELNPDIADVLHSKQISTELYSYKPWQVKQLNFQFSNQPSGEWTLASLVGDIKTKLAIPLEYQCYPDNIEGKKLCVATSNGVAAHTSLSKSLVASVYEVFERDALMVHWFNSIPRERIIFPYGYKARLHRLQRLGFKIIAINLSLEFAPVILVILKRESDMYPRLLLGMGSHFNPRVALNKALQEAELNVTYYNINVPAPSEASEIATIMSHQFWYDLPQNHAEIECLIGNRVIDISNIPSGDKSVRSIKTNIERNGYEWYFTELNSTGAQQTGIVVVRSIVPGLVPIGFGYGLEPLGLARLKNAPTLVSAKANIYRQTKQGYKPQPFA